MPSDANVLSSKQIPPAVGTRTSPYFPTSIENAALAIFPGLLLFGAAFSLISPETRAAPYDPIMQAHVQDSALAPSYFARKSNMFNVLFVKRGWAWITVAHVLFILTHPAVSSMASRRAQSILRWGLVTGWWFLVTQWCFGPAIIDRGFRWTGGKCDMAEMKLASGVAEADDVFTAVACKAAGGKWSGGHDISGHVFLLVLGSGFLMQEVGWAVFRWRGQHRDRRSVVMSDGAVKSAGVEAQGPEPEVLPTSGWLDSLGIGGKFSVAVIALSCWMLLMTAIYFHTWFEKVFCLPLSNQKYIQTY
jgi:hypothetical protein